MGLSIPFCFIAALVLKAPQPLTHAVNYAVYPIQIPLIFVFVRLGELIVGAPIVSLAPSEILDLAKTDTVRFIEEFGPTCLARNPRMVCVGAHHLCGHLQRGSPGDREVARQASE